LTKRGKIINVGAMRFQCPACGFSGGVRIPAHLPKGKTVRIRCSRCQKSFPLSLGKLFPQEYPAGYQALIPDSLSCGGTKVGRLWVETVGSREDRVPVIVFPAHPSLSHDVMHDLLDSFGDYFRICYLEFPGTRRNPKGSGKQSYSALFSDHMELLKKHLGVLRFHLLAHLGSSPLALDIATRHPDSVTSVVLIEPDLRLAEHAARQSIIGKLKSTAAEERQNGEHRELLVSLLQDVWCSKLPQPHAQGLAKILSPGFQPDHLNHDLIQSRSTLHYATLSRRKIPILIIFSRDGGEAARKCALYLQATLPAAETGTVEKGGAWAAWFRQSAIANKLLSFKRSAESKDPRTLRKRSHTLSGQPLGWMVLVFAILAAGSTLGSSLLRFQPEFMSGVIPSLLAGLLPILWFVIPKKINPIAFFRFRRFSLRTVLLPLAIGAVLGAFFRSLLLTLKNVSLPAALPAFLISSAPGSRGRLLELVGAAIVSLFVFGVAENLWVLRRSRLQVLMPTVLFALLPPAFPDILWKLPGGFAASVLFATSLSIYAPLFLIAGFATASELPIPFDRLPIYWGSIQGVAVTTALLAAAILLTVFLGTSGNPVSPEELYFAGTINRQDRLFRWGTSLGIVLIVFSLIAAAGLVFAFMAV
jgi:pimeloyl-ACP methyl ester carboxylesterase